MVILLSDILCALKDTSFQITRPQLEQKRAAGMVGVPHCWQ